MSDNPMRIPRIIHKHVHDVRNSINCLELLAMMVEDQATDPAMARPLATLRAELTQLEATVNSLQFKFAEPHPSTITADDLMRLWKNKIAPLENATQQISWSPPTASESLTVDVNAILSVLQELVLAGWYCAGGGMLHAAVSTTEASVLAAVREPHPHAQREAHDLEEARRLVEMNGGTLDFSENTVSGERVVTLKFPAGGTSDTASPDAAGIVRVC